MTYDTTGHWECDDFPGQMFDTEDDIKDILHEELWEEADARFEEWIDDTYSAHQVWNLMANRNYDALDFFDECTEYVWDDETPVYEGEDATVLGHRFVWVDDTAENDDDTANGDEDDDDEED